MPDFQEHVLQWISRQGLIASFLIFALAVLHSMQGFRFSRALFAVSSTLTGFAVGAFAGALLDVPLELVALASAVVCGMLALLNGNFGIGLVATATFGALGYYLPFQLGVPHVAVPFTALLGAGAGIAAYWLHASSLPVILTSIHGAALFIVSFAGLSSVLLPPMGATFVRVVSEYGPVAPILMLMMFVTGYACQATSMRGGIETGTRQTWTSAQV
jgi:hypothetical protein